MKLTYFKGEYPNFGDDLNYWMWPKLLPDFFDENEDTVFLGIGSIIGEKKFSASQKKIIFGSGFVPEYHDKPAIEAENWDVRFVRGPRTAKMLDLAPELSLGDSAILLRTLVDYAQNTKEVVSFMPHWQSLDRGNWEEVCKAAGINIIDPRRSVDEVIAELMRTKLIVTEAMHGAIVADAFRIPWVAVLPINHVHRAKWYDWAEALELTVEPHRLFPSSLLEARLSVFRKVVDRLPFKGAIEKLLIKLSAYRLRQLAKAKGCLSDDKVMQRVTEEMQKQVKSLQQDYGNSKLNSNVSA